MALQTSDAPVDDPPVDPDPADRPAGRPRSRRRRRWLVVAAGVLLVVVVAVLWFLLGREQAAELSEGAALAEFRAGGASTSDAGDRPAAGVYQATASGTESIGLPGFDESFGPDAPVTVTHGEDGCFTYRADFNSHHWREWTFCPTDTATFSLTRLDSWTARKAPGLDISTITSYRCEQPLDFLWDGMAEGDTRTSSCTGSSDMDDTVTADAGRIEVLGSDHMTIGGERVAVVHARTTDTFTRDQTGYERGEWWILADTGLPVRFAIDASLEGGPSAYSENPTLELSTLSPAT
jgi:hypothetical protein